MGCDPDPRATRARGSARPRGPARTRATRAPTTRTVPATDRPEAHRPLGPVAPRCGPGTSGAVELRARRPNRTRAGRRPAPWPGPRREELAPPALPHSAAP